MNRRTLIIAITVAAFFACAAAQAAEPKGGVVAPDSKDRLIFMRSAEKESASLWIWTEGEKPRRLTSGGNGVGGYVISEKAKLIVYQTPTGEADPYTPYALAKETLDSGREQQSKKETNFLDKPPANVSDLNPVLSPDGKLLVFNRINLGKYGKPDYDGGVWYCRADSDCSKPKQFWKSPKNHVGVLHAPRNFSPDGTLLAVQRMAFGAADIGDTLVFDVAKRKVLNTFQNSRLEAWSPNGSKIIAGRIDSATGCRQLYIGSGRDDNWKLLTPDEVSDNEPVFSPDGRRIAVHTRDSLGDSTGIWIIDIAGGQRTQLTARGTSPQWTRDGKRIYFRRRDDENEWVSEIWMIELPNGDPKLMLKNAGRFRLINGMTGTVSDEGGF